MKEPWLTRRAAVEERVATALQKCAAAVVPVARGVWQLSLANGAPLQVGARVLDDWVVLEASPAVDSTVAALDLAAVTPSAPHLWALLRDTAELAGGAKLALDPDRGLRARAEVPLDDDASIGRRLVQACAGIAAGAARIRGVPPHSETTGTPGPPPSVDLVALCQATAWGGVLHGPHAVTTDLCVPGAFRQAVIRTCSNGKLAASVDLGGPPAGASSPVCRAARAHFLLRSNRLVRMARAAAAGETPRFETVFDDVPSPAELGCGLAALSVACRIAGAEAEVLAHDEGVATAYLRTSMRSAKSGPFDRNDNGADS
jgi:hypothetical protein